jgi:hypothetical protein
MVIVGTLWVPINWQFKTQSIVAATLSGQSGWRNLVLVSKPNLVRIQWKMSVNEQGQQVIEAGS